MDDRSRVLNGGGGDWADEGQGSVLGRGFLLLIWLMAGASAFLPFAAGTSPWDAVLMHVPENQGNWWHVLVGVPFFLAFPMIWLRLRMLFRTRPLTKVAGRILWGAVVLSVVGTIAVEAPFLLHLAGTSAWQRLAVLGLGLGIVVASGGSLFVRRREIPTTRACLAGLNTVYLANAALCLVVYSDAVGDLGTRSGWMVTMVIVWPMLAELIAILVGSGARVRIA